MLLETVLFNESPETVAVFMRQLRQDKETIAKVSPALPNQLVAGKAAKRLFAKYADRQFLNSLTLIHWSKQITDLLSLVDDYNTRNHELSCNATLGKIPTNGLLGDHGLVVKGHITLLANDMDDVYSGSHYSYRQPKGKNKAPGIANSKIRMSVPSEPNTSSREEERLFADRERWYADFFAKRMETSGINKGLASSSSLPSVVLDKEDFKESFKSEALVDHWKPLAIIVPRPNTLLKIPGQPKFFIGTPEQVEKYLRERGLL
jgi:hypothetical protein